MKNLISLVAIVSVSLLSCDKLAYAQGESEQKAVLVTGASSGIGLRIAETLAENGFYVYAGARKAMDMERLDAIENISSVRLDVTVQQDIDAAVEFVRGEGRGLWGVVNNAGVISLSSLVNVDIADVQFTFDVNVFGPIRVNRAFLPMIIGSQGRTTIIGSINGFIASAEDGGYTASKFAVEGYTDSLADELADSGVHVSIVDPGAYRSEIRVKMLAQQLAAADAGEIVLVVHWKGGRHTELRVKKPKTGEHGAKTSDEALGIIREMAGRWSDTSIAASLNRMALRTGQGKTWNAKRVSSEKTSRVCRQKNCEFAATKPTASWSTLA